MKIMTKKNAIYVLIFIVGLVVGVVGTKLFTRGNSSSDSTNNDQALVDTLIASSTDGEIAPGTIIPSSKGGEIKIQDQIPGTEAIVAESNLTSPEWIAIQESVNGKPGNVLGAKLFDKGMKSGIISLLKPMVAGQTYFAVLHQYSGVKSSFNVKSDTPVLGSDDLPVMVQFNVDSIKDLKG